MKIRESYCEENDKVFTNDDIAKFGYLQNINMIDGCENGISYLDLKLFRVKQKYEDFMLSKILCPVCYIMNDASGISLSLESCEKFNKRDNMIINCFSYTPHEYSCGYLLLIISNENFDMNLFQLLKYIGEELFPNK